VEGVVAPSNPVVTELNAPYEIARWRPFVQWLLASPHFLLLYVLSSVASFLAFIAWFAILFTGRYPKGPFDFNAMYLRYQWRTLSFAGGFHDSYPPFEFEMESADDGHSPAAFDLAYPESLSRGLIFVKWLLLIPHAIALCFVGTAAFFAYGIGVLAVLFTGRWPQGIRDFCVGTARWSNRMTAYAYLMTDAYPPFSLH
jgi:hypothetical protein